MSNFIAGGVECGPTSALKDVSSRVDRDYGLQRDRYAAQHQAGPSAGPSAFRTRPGAPAGPAAQAQPSFDLSQLRSHLPAQAGPVHTGPTMQMQPAQAQAPARWAEGFDSKGKSRAVDGLWGNEFGRQQSASPAQQQQPQAAPWQRGPAFAEPRYMGNMGMPMMPQMPMYQPQPVYQQPPTLMHPAPQKAVPLPPTQVPQEPAQQQEQPRQGERPHDELARTAQALVDQLDKEELGQNQKLAESQFVRLLRGLGDGSVVVQEGSSAAKEGTEVGEGAKFVDSNGGGDWASAFLDSGSAPQTMQQAATATGEFQTALTMNDDVTGLRRRKSVHFDEPTFVSAVPSTLEEAQNMTATAVPGASTSWEEDLTDDFNDEAFMQYNGRMPQIAEQTGQTTSDREGWDELTASWYDQDTAPQPYLFHQANPYAMGAPIVRELSPTTMGVLELEAAVQQEPRDASAWLALGLKQQENEREDAAIRALHRAVELQPETRAAWLALAVSYTNEGKDDRAHDALEHWLNLTQPGGATETMGESRDQRATRIVNRLIDIARQRPDDLDVDVQVALGVLFNASEDYAKAEDCFTAALEARPDDWVLHNRLGATLANSGRSHEAIKFYHRALGLHPNFVRAQFNLGISYINLAQYRLAAQCIVDAIRLQHSDVTEGYGADSTGDYTKGVTSEALWTTLRMACLHLQRPDLVALANQHDLSGFPLEL
ncbi:uncharacterized protein CcaverHIS019_0311890 [Cutaneotrichosporon cavernicola]|uniref:TPR-like protein n=1 Tax=Cutaneotrichosporon cavernicola TaxID=279322 RepID=A0AA48L371_9TREE|nr:uncharacterized protein CcaverHIS019_0311890 [Cutaneotrichosporon cavernicola]BEI91119.1 hypothetical protein CcaverHIS019_0311890 [Cutaneotrichosporon cavernicola]BEI98896.1 hypothetical protein CcaverHIS631_0311950 [Cutaneotrichosporon cavernicola]BEJ06669.1 hypothetical protein CcaverHIS641_0311910 [Cutaneotrichosporon cavernicola]